MRPLNPPLEPYFRIRKVEYGTAQWAAHTLFVLDSYRHEGFVPEHASSIVDEQDDEYAHYYLLYSRDDPDRVAGTWRILDGAAAALPALDAAPHQVLAGLPHRLCESTRVVGRGSRFHGRSDFTRSILFEAVIEAVCHLRRNGLIGVISLGSPTIFEWINATFAGSQRASGPPFLYRGGMVVPSVILLEEFEQRVRERASRVYAYYEYRLHAPDL